MPKRQLIPAPGNSRNCSKHSESARAIGDRHRKVLQNICAISHCFPSQVSLSCALGLDMGSSSPEEGTVQDQRWGQRAERRRQGPG